MTSWIPAFYFPTTTLIVNDSRESLSRLTNTLDPNIAYITHTSQRDALQAIQTAPISNQLAKGCFSEYSDHDGYPLTNHSVTIDISELYQNIYNPQRFTEISVVVVDATMSGMRSLEFCERINHHMPKKILLGESYEETWLVKAFNAGIIDFYINKNDLYAGKQINKYIKTAQLDYFQTKTKSLNHMLMYSSAQCLADDKFIAFFKQLCIKHNIIEYYLIENTGCFLLISLDGRLSSLIVKNRQDLLLHYELAADNNAPETVLKQLASGQSVPYCWPIHEFYNPDIDWATKLYPANKLQADDLYYYALITTPLQHINSAKLKHYRTYLEHLSTSYKISPRANQLAELADY